MFDATGTATPTAVTTVTQLITASRAESAGWYGRFVGTLEEAEELLDRLETEGHECRLALVAWDWFLVEWR
jgi:hypothetical protein